MALKDHILKLADGVSKCQENAKSLAQVIFRGLDDIADNLPEPTPSTTVTVTPIVDEGVKIASITVNENTSDLYAPNPMHMYSTTEHIVGKWIDGTTDVYEKIIDIGTIEAGARKEVDHGIQNMGLVIFIMCIGYNIAESNYGILPKVDSDERYQRGLRLSTTQIIIESATFAQGYTNCYATIRYLKSS